MNEEPVVVNRSRGTFHRPDCDYVHGTSNEEDYPSALSAIEDGYMCCKECRPCHKDELTYPQRKI